MPVVAFLQGPVSSWSKYIMSYFITRAVQSKQKVLPIVIDSPGGSIYAMRGIIDMINASGLEINTVCTGVAASAASIIFSMGKKRMLYPSASLIIHESRTWFGADSIQKGSDLKAMANGLEKMTNDAYQMLDSSAGKQSGYFKNLVYQNGNADLTLWADDAKKHGLVTDVKVPGLKDLFNGQSVINTQEDDEDDGPLFLSLMNESKAEIAKLKAQYDHILNTNDYSEEQALNQNILYQFQEESPTMCVQNKSTKTEAAPQPKEAPTSSANLATTDFQALLDAQSKKFEERLESVRLQAKEEAKKEVAQEYETTVLGLKEQLLTLSADNVQNKKEKELTQLRSRLQSLVSENKLTRSEMASEEEFILKFTSTEGEDGGSREAYLKKLEGRPKSTVMQKEAMFNDKSDVKLSDSAQRAMNRGASREQVLLISTMDEYIDNNKLERNSKTLSAARAYAFKKYPHLANDGVKEILEKR